MSDIGDRALIHKYASKAARDAATKPTPAPVLADILVDEGGLPFMYRVRIYAVTVVAEEEEGGE